MDFGSPIFWVAFGQIILADILLSGDNAIVIALAARSLPPEQQKRAILIGSGAAIVMRTLLTLVAAQLLMLPWLKLIGAALLWVGWFGFNAGSALAANERCSNEEVALVDE
jgi:predicted tellurium resistance membrane protein TerC